MKIRIIAATALLVGATAGILAFKGKHADVLPAGREGTIVTLVSNILEKGDYHPKPIDRSYSIEVYDKYLKSLDDEKKFFIQPDIDYLNRYRESMDQEMLGQQPLGFFHDADSIYEIRLHQAQQLYPQILAKPFDYSRDESIDLNGDTEPYASDTAALRDVWRKLLKYKTLDLLIGLQNQQKALKADSAGMKEKSEDDLQAEARGRVEKIFDHYFVHIGKVAEKERFSMFMDAVTHTMDPHTDYFAPVDNRYFDETMSGVFYGIGALLQGTSEGSIKIANIVTGGPAWKEGELKQGDVILKVAQGDKEPVDITGFETDDAVKIIRGDKGTTVRLTVKQTNGTMKTISIVRDEVHIDETFAKSFIINNGNHKIGFIVLPEFYADFEQANGRHSSADMLAEINKLNATGVDGIILDLRFNGGGSLADAVDIGGLFEPQGPVVQVRSGDGSIQVDRNHNGPPVYRGPLAVLVNEYSASASEILVAALQDYGRAVIIGSPSTYGKGTVQRKYDLDDFLQGDKSAFGGPLGDLKLTIQKFYRINGGSTQLKGVVPDIILPDPYFGVAERTDKDAMAWDQIPAAHYQAWDQNLNLGYLETKSQQRVSASPAFRQMASDISLMKKLDSEKIIPLNMTAYRSQLSENDAALKKMDNITKQVPELQVANLSQDLTSINSDSTAVSLNHSQLQGYRKDMYLDEAVNVMNDMINMGNLNGKLSRNGN
jgi:carboxyl-terminal processing protease